MQMWIDKLCVGGNATHSDEWYNLKLHLGGSVGMSQKKLAWLFLISFLLLQNNNKVTNIAMCSVETQEFKNM